EAVAAKQRALRAYRSQTAITARFLWSFVRRDELFGTLPPHDVSVLNETGVPDEAYLHDWDRYLPVIADSAQDTFLRDIHGSADLVALYAVAGPERLHVRLVTRKPLSPRITYRLRLRPMACADP